MRKITPMILVALMLVSALSSFDFAELEETEVIEDAGARAGADAEMVAITNPKETVCPFGAACRNVMKVGDVTEFSSYIQNSGDADITEMGYSVTVYLSDADGNPGMIAKDATTGADLSWTNNDVICPAAAGCPFQSLGAGDVLGGGSAAVPADGVAASSPNTTTCTHGEKENFCEFFRPPSHVQKADDNAQLKNLWFANVFGGSFNMAKAFCKKGMLLSLIHI